RRRGGRRPRPRRGRPLPPRLRRAHRRAHRLGRAHRDEHPGRARTSVRGARARDVHQGAVRRSFSRSQATLGAMARLLVNWLLSALALMIVAHITPGFYVADFSTALVASLVIGLINATLGLVLKIVTAPLTILTLGGFLLVVNALMLMVAASIVRGFEVRNFWAAFIGGIVLTFVDLALHWLVRKAQSPRARL